MRLADAHHRLVARVLVALVCAGYCTATFAETIKLPVTGRRVSLDFAIQLSKGTWEEGLQLLTSRGVRILYWSRHEGISDHADLSGQEKAAIEVFLEGCPSILATALYSEQPVGDQLVSKDTIVLKRSELPLPNSVLAHEWLHLVLFKLSSREPLGIELPSVRELAKAIHLQKPPGDGIREVLLRNIPESTVSSSASELQTLVNLDYLDVQASLATLFDEWDIHFALADAGIAEDREVEYRAVALHLVRRIQSIRRKNALYRALVPHPSLLTKSAMSDGECAIDLERRLAAKVEWFLKEVKRRWDEEGSGGDLSDELRHLFR